MNNPDSLINRECSLSVQRVCPIGQACLGLNRPIQDCRFHAGSLNQPTPKPIRVSTSTTTLGVATGSIFVRPVY